MQSIETKIIPATNTKPSRIKAQCARGSIVVPYPHELSGQSVHISAASALIQKFINEDVKKYGAPADKNPWAKPFVTGQLKNGNYVHVFIA